MADEYLWQGVDLEGTACFISRAQWTGHVSKRREIMNAFDLTVRAIIQPGTIEPDRNRPDEPMRHFRLLSISAEELRHGFILRVSVKSVRQANGVWYKFYQSCWLERK